MPQIAIDYAVLQPDRVLVSVEERLAHLAGMEANLIEAAMIVYEGTLHWFDSQGEGSWPALAESTVERKARQTLSRPDTPLVAHGDLRESVTSPTGPHSYFIPMFDGVVFGAVWTPIRALAEGTTTAGRGHNTTIPARPIFPPADSATGRAMAKEIAHLMMFGKRSGGGLKISHSDHIGGVNSGPSFAPIGTGGTMAATAGYRRYMQGFY